MKPLFVEPHPFDKDENESLPERNEKAPLSPCIESPSSPLSSESSFSPTTDVRSPSPDSGRTDLATLRKDLSSSSSSSEEDTLELPSIEQTPPDSSFSSLLSSFTPNELQESEDVQDAVTAWQVARRKETPTRSETATCPAKAMGFSSEVSKAFSDGTLLPYFMSLLQPPAAPAIQDEYHTTWNGHLPLEPFPSHDEESSGVQWRMPRSRRKRRLTQPQSQQENDRPTSPQHTIFPTTLSNPNEFEILFHSNENVLVCVFIQSNQCDKTNLFFQR